MNSEKEKPGSWEDKRATIPSRAVLFIWIFFIEWLMEWVSYWFSLLALIEILGYVARFSILVAVIVYFTGADERRQQAEDQRKAKHYQAWQDINAASGKPGERGRTGALEDLNKDGIYLGGINLFEARLGRYKDTLWIGVDLAGAHLDRSILSKAFLEGANLKDAKMRECHLDSADLRGADLTGANLTEADLTLADLTGADLTGADLSWAVLSYAWLREANLSGANLTEADLIGAVLTWAVLSRARLRDADLSESDLFEADLRGADLTGVDLSEANLSGSNLREANLSLALLSHANLFRVDISGANFYRADLRGADLLEIKGWKVIKDLRFADVYGLVNPPNGFLEWAVNEMGALCVESSTKYKTLRDSLREEAEKRGPRPGRLQPDDIPIAGLKTEKRE